MDLSLKEISTELARKMIRPSIQRVKVFDYLMKNPGHPTVDQIYRDLHKEIPTLSKTTIYNTLDLFAGAGLVRILNIEDNEIRYDIIVENHGHFKCKQCGSIYNFSIDVNSLSTDDLAGFQIVDRNVYFKGICPQCLINININMRKELIL